MQGVVSYFSPKKLYGFISSDDGQETFVHASALQGSGKTSLSKGQRVEFIRVKRPKGYAAESVVVLSGPSEPMQSDAASISAPAPSFSPAPVAAVTGASEVCREADAKGVDAQMESEEIEELDTKGVNTKLLQDVANWKREAKAEDNDRYFWHVREVDQISRGERYFVIGRKGSGKTAICEYFNRIQNYGTFAEKLTFKNFPFNELYSHTNEKYTPPNQFISLWKYLIYSTVCRMMLKNEAVDQQVREELSALYGEDVPLSRRVGKWVRREFGFSLLGLSFKVTKHASGNRRLESWIDSVDFLEDLVLRYAGDATYFVLFDELDEDYRKILEEGHYDQYTPLITSLFKAVQDIRTTFEQARTQSRVYPVIFLRDDIYELVQDADKNKWGDFRVDLNWDEEKIKRVIAFRISRAINSECTEILPFDRAWEKLFGTRTIRIGNRRRVKNTFEYIARSTLLRPRDFVEYLKNCAQQALDEGTKISPGIVRRVDRAFSNYLRDELTDELFAILPDISNIFDAISQLRKWNFSIQELEDAYSDQVKRGFIKDKNVKFVLQVLYLFSVIGNFQGRSGRYTFRYQNREARLNFNEPVVVHRGLFKALQII